MWTAGRRVTGYPSCRDTVVVVLLAAVVIAVVALDSRRAAAAPPVPKRLPQAFVRAAEAIRRHQEPEGSWVTVGTPRARFEKPFSPHVNVFVPSMIVDLLAPIAADAGLGDVVARGRDFLRQQIEDTGLARYMGKRGQPGQPGVAAPGCETPADADDTALIWRLAPGAGPALLQSARRVLERYRTPDGLYRTWLADEEPYRCFHTRYPGRERNPADVGIQMHLYLFFAQHDPDAARALCTALRARMRDERIWVWYTAAPLVPLLREAELARAGCTLKVPEERLRRVSADQAPYVRLGQRLTALLAGSARDVDGAVDTLAVLAGDDMTRMQKHPPLLYHNDLSWPAADSGYYWSEDVGYALWLRTYVEAARLAPGRISMPARPGRRS